MKDMKPVVSEKVYFHHKEKTEIAPSGCPNEGFTKRGDPAKTFWKSVYFLFRRSQNSEIN